MAIPAISTGPTGPTFPHKGEGACRAVLDKTAVNQVNKVMEVKGIGGRQSDKTSAEGDSISNNRIQHGDGRTETIISPLDRANGLTCNSTNRTLTSPETGKRPSMQQSENEWDFPKVAVDLDLKRRKNGDDEAKHA